MKHHQNLSPDRKFIRLVGYDYRLPGVYFVSIVTWQRECLFGNVVEGKMRLNSVGKIVQSEWKNLEHHFPYIRTDASIVMPNHIHGIIIIDSKFSVGATQPTKLDNKEIKISVVEPIVDGLSGSPEIGMVVQKARATRHTANVLTDNGATWVNEIDADPNGSPLQVSAGPNGPRAGSVGMIVARMRSTSYLATELLRAYFKE
jgi:hypothetical protein